jgi:alkanesulfonate monooxygenase SsuD/methylene tetrahydromethanopterin reductase-like flavin-dependent oxidoreductase (luciferase family)
VALARGLERHVLLEVGNERQARLAARLADGVVSLDESAEALRPVVEALRRERESTGQAPLEIWARVKMPDDCEQWRRMHREYEDVGATGLVLPLDHRLLDQIRNGDEEDDRSDLQLAQG